MGGSICQSLPAVELGASKDLLFLKYSALIKEWKTFGLPSSTSKEDRQMRSV